jgi:CDGSH-type Zn-finger protein
MPGSNRKPAASPRPVPLAAAAPAMKVVVTAHGPLVVSGGVPLTVQVIRPNEGGLSWTWEETRTIPTGPEYELCRCGHSATKPFCDESHLRVKFDGTETASRQPFVRQAERLDGPTLLLDDVEGLCAFARFCDPGGKIWSLIGKTGDAAARRLAIREGMSCPAGRLVLHDKRSGRTIEPELPPSIGLVEDPVLGVSGPVWVRGRIRIESEDGKPYEVRNRVTLCRCGASNNQPYCNGSHATVGFHDGLGEPAPR